MKQRRLAWSSAGVLLAGLLLGACSKPGEPATQAVRDATGSAASGAPSSGTGLTGNFPPPADPARAARQATGTMGNNSGAPALQRP